VTAAWTLWGPAGFAPLLVVVGLYLVGPLWMPAHYRIADSGVTRRTPFGSRETPWAELLDYAMPPGGGAAWLTRRGRGSARFLPQVLLLWDEAATPGLGDAVDAALAARLVRRGGTAT
jgi:hypothetical protein